MIEIFHKGALIGNADTFKIHHSLRSSRLMSFIGFEGGNNVDLSMGEDIELRIYGFNKNRDVTKLITLDIYLVDPIELPKGKHHKIDLYGHLFPPYVNSGDEYDQYLVDVFYRWKNNKEVETSDWINFTEEEKEAYIRACSIYSNLPKTFPTDVILDGNLIKDSYDLYFFISKFYDKRGFFALGLDSLEDSMIEINKNSGSLKGQKIVIKNIGRIDEKFYKGQYFEMFLSILKDAELDIVLEE